MKSKILLGLVLVSTFAVAADDEAALKAQMKEVCAPLFVAGAPCADLAKGSRNCVRQNKEAAGKACVDFEKGNQAFFEAGKNDPIVKK